MIMADKVQGKIMQDDAPKRPVLTMPADAAQALDDFLGNLMDSPVAEGGGRPDGAREGIMPMA